MLIMYEPAASVSPTPEKSHSYTRADALEAEITELCAHINAASYRLLQLVAALDDEAPWGAWGLASCTHWLNWHCGIRLNAAREKVRAAQVEKLVRAYRRVGRLEERECASAQHACGELTYYYDDDGSLVIRARLPADEGAVVLQALNAAMDAQESDAEPEDVTAVTLADDRGVKVSVPPASPFNH